MSTNIYSPLHHHVKTPVAYNGPDLKTGWVVKGHKGFESRAHKSPRWPVRKREYRGRPAANVSATGRRAHGPYMHDNASIVCVIALEFPAE